MTSCGRPYRWRSAASGTHGGDAALAAARSRQAAQRARPSGSLRSRTDPDKFCGLKLEGTATKASGSKKTQSVTATHPIESDGPTERRASRASLSRSSASSRVPFAWPKTSHARQTGRDASRAKSPNPPIRLIGDFRRKKNGSPGARAANLRPPGRQKLTSRKSGRAWRNLHHPGSVWPMYPFIVI